MAETDGDTVTIDGIHVIKCMCGTHRCRHCGAGFCPCGRNWCPRCGLRVASPLNETGALGATKEADRGHR